jgi:hypothetical protein
VANCNTALVQFLGGHAGLYQRHQHVQRLGCHAAGLAHALEVGLSVQLDLPVIGERRGRGVDISGLHKHYTRKFRTLRQDR